MDKTLNPHLKSYGIEQKKIHDFLEYNGFSYDKYEHAYWKIGGGMVISGYWDRCNYFLAHVRDLENIRLNTLQEVQDYVSGFNKPNPPAQNS